MRTFFKKHEKSLFIVIDIALNGFNYLFHILVSRFVAGSDYGRFNALLSVASILFVTGIAFQSYMARTLAQEKKIRREMHSIALSAILFASAICIIVLFFQSYLLNFLRADFPELIIILLIFITNLVLSIGRGIFQAREQFYRLSISFYLEVLTKIALLAVFISLGLNINRTLFSILGGMAIALSYAAINAAPNLLRISRSWKNIIIEKKTQTLRRTIKSILLIMAGNIFLYYFMAVDMLIVNRRLPDQAGIFAVVLRYSQLIFFAGFSLFAVLTPKLNKNAASLPDFRKTWKQQFLLISGLIIVALIGYLWVLPHTVAPLFGKKYSGAAEFIPLAGVTYSALLLIFFQVNAYIALHSRKYLLILAILGLLLPSCLIIFSKSIRQILLIEGALFAATMIVLLFYLFHIIKSGGLNEKP